MEKTSAAFSALLCWLRENYQNTLASLKELLAHNEITFDLLYGILIPNTVLVARDGATGELRALRLISFSHNSEEYVLNCEGLEAADARKDATASHGRGDRYGDGDSDEDDDYSDEEDYSMDENEDDEGFDEDRTKQGAPQRAAQRAFGMSSRSIRLRAFDGTQKINKLSVFPMKYHSNPSHLRADLIKRGRKWASLCGVYHVYYNGLGGRQGCNGYVKYNVSSIAHGL